MIKKKKGKQTMNTRNERENVIQVLHVLKV